MSEAEAALINALIVDPTQIPSVADLAAGDFSSPAYGEAYMAITKLWEEGKTVDILALKRLGIEVEPHELTGRFAPATEYAEMVREGALRHRVAVAAEALMLASETAALEEIGLRIDEAIASIKGDEKPAAAMGGIDLNDYRSGPPAPHLGVIAPEGTTVIYGDGGDGKGWIAASLIAKMLSNGMKVAILDFENHPNEWAYRLDRLGVQLGSVLYLAPTSTFARWANAAAVRLLRQAGTQLIVVDSAMYAANTEDPYSPKSALDYKSARARLDNLPCLLLAHIAKGQSSIFGSVFWRNEARIVWHLTQDWRTHQRTLECKKANAYEGLEGIKYIVEFDDKQTAGAVVELHGHGVAWFPKVLRTVDESGEEMSW